MLRPVREDSLEYLEMLDSIKDWGVMNSIAVRPHPTRDGVFEIIDGMWRYCCCRALGFEFVPCIVMEDVSDEDILSIQIAANAVSYDTRPVEFAQQMKRMIRLHDSVGAPLSLNQLGRMVGKSGSWVSSRLKLLDLHDELQEELTAGTMGLGQGTALARIRKHKYQLELWQEHKDKTLRPFELEVGKFIQNVHHDLDVLKEADRQKETLRPRLQSMDSMLMELDRLDEISQIIVGRGLTTAYEGAILAIEWTLNLHEEGRYQQVQEKRFQLSDQQRIDIVGRQQYEELREIRRLREERGKTERENFNQQTERENHE
jgi:ParB family chromosome partitioning protein